MHRADSDPDCDSNRREEYKAFYSNLLGDCITVDLLKIKASLFDSWSEIRKDSAKSLRKLDKDIPQEVVIALVDDFLSSNGEKPWQMLHGSLLGIAALWESICRYQHIKLTHIRNTCVMLLSHTCLPVRDAARACIHNFLSTSMSSVSVNELDNRQWDIFYSSILHSASEMARTDVLQGSEGHALQLDGALGCVGDAVPYISPRDPGRHGHVQVDHGPFLDVLHLCLGHPSSTVRQRAAAVMISLCGPLADYCQAHIECIADDAILRRVVRTLLGTLSDHPGQWWPTEGTLLVVEEICAQFALLCKDKHSVHVSDVLCPLISTLIRDMCRLVGHTSFEVRRVFSQVLPSLARVCVVSAVYQDNYFHNVLRDSIDIKFFVGMDGMGYVQDTVSPVGVEVSGLINTPPPAPPPAGYSPPVAPPVESSGHERTELLVLLGAKVYCAWIAELLRCTYLLLDTRGGDKTEAAGHGDWALRASRRLGELEKQKLFRNSLVAGMNDCFADSGNTEYALIRGWISRISDSMTHGLRLCGHYMLVTKKLVSVDHIEAEALFLGLPHKEVVSRSAQLWLYSLAQLVILVGFDSANAYVLEALRVIVSAQYKNHGLGSDPGSIMYRVGGNVADPMSGAVDHDVQSLLFDMYDSLLSMLTNPTLVCANGGGSRGIASGNEMDSLLLYLIRTVLLMEYSGTKMAHWKAHYESGILTWALCLENMGNDECNESTDVVVYRQGLMCLLRCTWSGIKSVLDKSTPSPITNVILKDTLQLLSSATMFLIRQGCAPSEWTRSISSAVQFIRVAIVDNKSTTICNSPLGTADHGSDSENEFSDWDDDSETDDGALEIESVDVNATQIYDDINKMISKLEGVIDIYRQI